MNWLNLDLCHFLMASSGESVRSFIIFLLVNRDVAAINSQKNNKIIRRLPRICLSKNDISRVNIFTFVFASLFIKIFAFNFHTSEETLKKITEIISKKEKGVYLRFGDGDVLLANGQDDSYQKNNFCLKHEMREAFALNGPNVLKCLPLGCTEYGGLEEGMFEGNHAAPFEWCANIVSLAAPLWNGEMKDVYSMTALAHTATNHASFCLHFLKFLKESSCTLFVGNAEIPPFIVELLFGHECQCVLAPPRNSYTEIDRIEQECLAKVANVKGYKIIITSMGCSGRALQKRLWNRLDDVFLFDFGSLMDALCGWNTRQWIELVHFNSQEFIHLLEKELRDCSSNLKGQIRIICTSAIIPEHYEMRREEYTRSLQRLKNYPYELYVFEACHRSSPPFLEKLTPHVFYSNVNNPSLRNKGVNEAASLIEGFKYYRFNDEDMIVKLTGRYHLFNDHFLKIIESHPEGDVFVKGDKNHLRSHEKIFSGCFAMRHRFFKQMLAEMDLVKMEKEMIDIEKEIAHFIQQLEDQGAHVVYVDKLGVAANIGNACPPVVTYW